MLAAERDGPVTPCARVACRRPEGQDLMVDQTQSDRACAVADGVGDQFTDDQLCGVLDTFQAPFGQLAGCHVPGAADSGSVVRQRPGGDLGGAE
ncbi:hypothetical protein GCM10022206_49750 [Streptomyces chiangmaiensis]